ncbi:pentatricopeptide repeat-containing protein At1g69290 [Andrographis paniculata]|uniref:pentatricopeptide repeat-containing protein At1g69290 n=1 Tax=Andrographis paniculata TaxID=175694 RepID=UPI0021E838AA|nr:pentatricopeptide repeat-containing protein At1g69290 [Andrographis paniculata]XP_051146037.1 pentatricopeptide repeat-containing protein At1g69290 [Andrographis paniculata]
MRRLSAAFLTRRCFSSESEIPSLYSFLQPSIFALKTPNHQPQESRKNPYSAPISESQKSNLESALQKSLSGSNTDEAWKSFKALSNRSCLPSKFLTNSLIAHLSSLSDTHNLKRAYASVVYVLEKHPSLLEFDTVKALLNSFRAANTSAPAFALVKAMFNNRFFMPFENWGNILIDICRKNGSFAAFVSVFHETCTIAVDEKLDFMKPDLTACNAAMEFYCHEAESIADAEKVVEIMSTLGLHPDDCTFECLGYLYAVKGLNNKVAELESLICKLGVSDKAKFFHSLVRGYSKSGDIESVCATILRVLKEFEGFVLSQETCNEVVKGFMQNHDWKSLSKLILECQKLEPPSIVVEKSFGYGIMAACVSQGLLDKAHGILDEMNAHEVCVGLGVYVPILNAYCKERRTAEGAQLVTEISSLGLRLNPDIYDALIETSMSCQDYKSSFSIFRDMRESRISELKPSYLTIMTGLTEHHRPELMAAFLDEVVNDPRIEIATHDWNSIIHAFCKAGRLEDARRTFRRMIFLQYEPNEQTYLSLINGYVALEKYFSVLMLWNEVKRKISSHGENRLRLDNNLVDAFLYALVKGGFFDAVMQVVQKSQEMKMFVDKWRYKQAFMETHKKLRVAKLRKRNFQKMEALIAFKNWVGLSS